MAILYREVRQGAQGTIVYDCGDNSAIDTAVGAKDRLELAAGE